MNCRQFKKNLTLYLDQRLNAEKSLQVRRHLDNCPRCKAHYVGMKEISELGDLLPGIPLPDGFHERLMERLSQDRTEPARRWKPQRILAPLAAALLLAFIGRGLLISGPWKQMNFENSDSAPDLYRNGTMQSGMDISDVAAPESRALDSESLDGSLGSARADEGNDYAECAEDIVSVDGASGTVGEKDTDTALALPEGAAYLSDESSQSVAKRAVGTDADYGSPTKRITYPSIVIVTVLTAMAIFIITKFVVRK